MNTSKSLQSVSKGFRVLYVEDNQPLRERAFKFLKKFFDNVDLAEDGSAGLELFRKNRHDIVMTDIKMPKMDGIVLTEHIRNIAPDVKIIIMSAFDDKELLLKGIELKVFRFLKKPVNVIDLSEVLHKATREIQKEQDLRVFNSYIKDVFNYQNSMVIMLHDDEIVVANDIFLDFFGFESVEKCKNSIHDIEIKFLEHDQFLYVHDDIKPLKSIKEDEGKLYNVKVKSLEGNLKHFVLKYKEIPGKNDYGVLSFDDITELNLLPLFGNKQAKLDQINLNSKAVFNFLDIMQRNSAELLICNYYKGLSVANSGIIVDIKDEILTIKTTYIQQKTIQLEKRAYLTSSTFPNPIEARTVKSINFENQTVEFKDLIFTETSPLRRKTVRVAPSEKHTATLFMGEHKLPGEIEDISVCAVRLKMGVLPAGLNEKSDLRLNLVLELNKQPLIINTKVSMFRKSESAHSFSVVFMFEGIQKSKLANFITNQQMAVIREIKGLKDGY